MGTTRANRPRLDARGNHRYSFVQYPTARPRESSQKGIISFWSVDPDNREVWFDVFIKIPGAPSIEMHNITRLVGRIDLPTGDAVFVVGTEWSVTDEREATIEGLRRRTRDFYIGREGLDSFNRRQQPTATNWDEIMRMAGRSSST
jgi:hypothetical protein